jgi:glycosyltransferase involved in cell wall biosynthesis
LEEHVTRALLLTSHPVDGRDGADKEIAVALAEGLRGVDFTYFGRLGVRSPVRGRKVAVLSRRGMPGILERGQVAVRTPVLARRVELVHAVMTIGPQFAHWSRSRLLPRDRPIIHTVPGIASPEALSRTWPLGVTVALAEPTARTLRSAGFPDVRVVPPGIDLHRWEPTPRPGGPRPVLLFAGHHGPDGGTEEALQTAALVEREGLPVRLVLAMRHRAGQDARREAQAVLARATALGLTEVAVHDRVADMPSLVRAADVVLFLPLRLSEGKADVPLTVVESMAAGRAVVVTDLPQLTSLGSAVSRVAAGDHDAAARAVLRLLRSPDGYAAAVAEARLRVVETFSAEAMCREYATIYAELLGRDAAALGPDGVTPEP